VTNEQREARKATEARMAAHRAETAAVYAANKCPRCGRPVKLNLSLTGWVQCTQYGSEQFRADPRSPSCDWQGFTA